MPAASAAGVTWWWPPHASNQPSQNSAHIRGPVTWCLRNAARREATSEPNDPVASTPGTLPFLSMSPRGWSTVVSGTVMPSSRYRVTRACRYSWSAP